MKRTLLILMVLIPSILFSQKPTDLLYATTSKQISEKLPSGEWDEGFVSPITSFPIHILPDYMWLQESFPEKHHNYQPNSEWVFRGKNEDGREYFVAAYDPAGTKCALILTLQEDTNFSLIIMYPEKAIIYYGIWKYK